MVELKAAKKTSRKAPQLTNRHSSSKRFTWREVWVRLKNITLDAEINIGDGTAGEAFFKSELYGLSQSRTNGLLVLHQRKFLERRIQIGLWIMI